MWAWLLAEQGITTDMLEAYPAGAEVPFLSMEQAAHNCDQFARLCRQIFHGIIIIERLEKQSKIAEP